MEKSSTGAENSGKLPRTVCISWRHLRGLGFLVDARVTDGSGI